jgi:phage terminase large subunit-like protein
MDAQKARAILEAKRARERTGKLMRVTFPPKIWRFINSTAQAAYLRGPNSGGKSFAMAYFLACTLIGRYPPEYTGWKPTLRTNDAYACVVWCLSKSGQVLRDAMQTHLLGDVAGGRTGEGLIPKESIVSVQMARGVAGAVDFAVIKRDDGQLSVVRFKSYEQGREMLQGERVHVVATDEMFDDEGVLSELLARGAGVNGIFRLSATERLQQSAVASWFYADPINRPIFGFGMDDVDRISPEEKARIKASYPPNELASRYYGEPFRGGGMIFQTPIEDILEDMDPGKFPPYYKYYLSLDFSHFGTSETSSQFAALFIALDPYTKVKRVFQEIKMRGSPQDHYAAILAGRGEGIPIAWPHDGQQGQADGGNIAGLYKRLGLRMHPHHATFGPGTDGGYNRESGIELINHELASGLWKVSRACRKFQAEYAGYERDEKGQPIQKNDDLMSAWRVAAMMQRIAKPLDEFSDRANAPRYRRDGSDAGYAIGAGPNMDWDIFTGQ